MHTGDAQVLIDALALALEMDAWEGGLIVIVDTAGNREAGVSLKEGRLKICRSQQGRMGQNWLSSGCSLKFWV